MVIQWYKLQTHLLNYVQPLDMQSTFLNLFPNWQGKRFSGKNAPWHQTNTSNLSFIVCFFFRSYFKLWISVLSAWIPAVTHSQLCQICQLFKVFFLCTIQFGYAGEVVDQFCGHAKSRASGPSTMNHYASFANQSLGVGALTTLALWNLIVSFCFENPLCSNGVWPFSSPFNLI